MKIPKIFSRSTHTRAYFNFATFHLASSQHQQFFNKQWIQCSQDCQEFPPTLMTSLLQEQPQRNSCITSVLDRIQQYGFRSRLDKCKFFQTSVKYLRFIFDKNGQRPDPENIHVIKQLTAPSDVLTLRSFLGLVSHYGSFLPELHKLRRPLNNLLQKDTK